ncbi:MAG: GNAT family N-acetyltransferase [Chitinispirillaceae bacterium]
MDNKGTDTVVRLMREDEKKATRRVLYRAFGWFKGVFSVFSPHTFIALKENEIVGGVILDIFTLPNGRKTGKVAWIFTAPQARGLSLGQRLAEKAIDFFREQGCDEQMAAVEGNNTSSSKLFATRGFDILPAGAQFRRYGVWTFLMWLKMFHYMSPGFFLWARPGDKKPDSPALQWIATLVLNITVLLLFTLRLQKNVSLWFYYSVSFFIFLGMRQIAMHTAAGIMKEKVRFRMWESGFPLSFLIAIFSGGFFPVPGNVYPDEKVWKYKDKVSTLGKVALSGIVIILIPFSVTWGYIRFNGSTNQLLSSFVMIGRIFLIFDLLFFFFPFIGFNGRRIWDWNKFFWAVPSAAALALIFL